MVSVYFVTDVSLDEKTEFLKEFADQGFIVNYSSIEEGLLWWVRPSEVKDEAPLDEWIEAIASLNLINYLPKYIEKIVSVNFDLAVFFDTDSCSISLSGEFLKFIHDLYPVIELEITCYPTDFEADDEEDIAEDQAGKS